MWSWGNGLGLVKVFVHAPIIPQAIGVFEWYLFPRYVIYNYLHLVGTYWPWFFGAFGTNTFFIFLFRQVFAGFPKELEGCSRK